MALYQKCLVDTRQSIALPTQNQNLEGEQTTCVLNQWAVHRAHFNALHSVGDFPMDSARD